MQAFLSLFGILLLLGVVGAVAVVPRYNRLQTMAQRVLAAHANIMVMQKKRVELMTKLSKAGTSPLSAMRPLTEFEAELQKRCDRYNHDVRQYNTMLTQVPAILFASTLGFEAAPYYDVENADSWENWQDFPTDDGTMLREMWTTYQRKAKFPACCRREK